MRRSCAVLAGLMMCGAAVAAASGGQVEADPQAIVFEEVAAPGLHPEQINYIHYAGNPIIPGANIYAPSPVKAGNTWYVFYGGWKTYARLGNDDVYLSTTIDPHVRGPWEHHDIVVARGIYGHANDPAVVRRGDQWVMALSVAGPGRRYWIAVVSSQDGINWNPGEFTDQSHEVRFTNVDFEYVHRPSLNWNDERERWEMYFDARWTTDDPRSQFLAYSYQQVPLEFEYVGEVGRWMDADIRRLPDGKYIAAFRNVSEHRPVPIRYACSEDGLSFTTYGVFLRPDAINPYDDVAVTNPGWAIDEDGGVVAVLFGGSDFGLTNHSLGVAYPQLAAQPIGTYSPHHLRQALSPDVQQVFVPAEERIDHVVIWRGEGCPLAALDLDEPLRQGARMTLQVDRGGDCLPMDRFTPPHLVLHSGQAYRPVVEEREVIVTASSSASERMPPENVTHRGGMWSSRAHASPDATEWIGIDFGEAVRVAGMTLWPRSRGHGFPLDFQIEYSLDGRRWEPVPGQRHAGYQIDDSAPQEFAFERPVELRHLRVTATRLREDQFGNYYFQLSRVTFQEE